MEFATSKDYEKLEQIGIGGYGRVYRIRGRTDGKEYALKIVDLDRLKSLQNDPGEATRVEKMAVREADVMKKVQPHEHIIKVFGCFTEETNFHIIMELMSKGTLKEAIIKQSGVAFPEDQIVKWATQLAVTLKHLHNRGILHRDVKSDNIFTTENNTLKLGDFGIAKSVNNNTTKNLGIGTVTHMAPEMLKEDDVNPTYSAKAEVWAFGVVMYEITQLELPFPFVKNPYAMARSICSNPIPPITVPVSNDLCSLIVESLLDRNPNTRPSMDQVIGHPCILNVITGQLTVSQQLPAADLQKQQVNQQRLQASLQVTRPEKVCARI